MATRSGAILEAIREKQESSQPSQPTVKTKLSSVLESYYDDDDEEIDYGDDDIEDDNVDDEIDDDVEIEDDVEVEDDEVDDDVDEDDNVSRSYSKILSFAYGNLDQFIDSEGNINNDSLEGLIHAAILDDPSLEDDIMRDYGVSSVDEFIDIHGDELSGLVNSISIYSPSSIGQS
jgi:hypothetical protein